MSLHGVPCRPALASLAVICLAASSCELLAPDEPEPPPQVVPERLDQDLARIAQLQRALASTPFTLAALLRELPDPFTRESRELGFDARWVELAFRGGHTTVHMSMLVVPPEAGPESVIARIRVEQVIHEPELWDEVEPVLGRAWSRGSSSGVLWNVLDTRYGKPSFRVERARPELGVALQQRIHAALGGAPASEPPAELAEAYRTLMDPLEVLAVGTSCGFIGSTPRGYAYAGWIRRAGRFDLLRSILRGPNPEARVFAASALIAEDALDAAEAAVIGTLARLPVQITMCSGCVGSRGSWQEALALLDQRR